MLRISYLVLVSSALAFTPLAASAGGPFHCHRHHCGSCCKKSCCDAEVIYVCPCKCCGDRHADEAGEEQARTSVRTYTQVVPSVPMMQMAMPMMPMMANPVQFAAARQPYEESARINDNCRESLCRERLEKVEDAVLSLDRRLSEVEEILELQTKLLKEFNERIKNEGE